MSLPSEVTFWFYQTHSHSLNHHELIWDKWDREEWRDGSVLSYLFPCPAQPGLEDGNCTPCPLRHLGTAPFPWSSHSSYSAYIQIAWLTLFPGAWSNCSNKAAPSSFLRACLLVKLQWTSEGTRQFLAPVNLLFHCQCTACCRRIFNSRK